MSQKKLHILFLCGWYPSRISPNNGDFIQRHANSIQQLHKVSVAHIISDAQAKENLKITQEFKNEVDTFIAYVKASKNPWKKAYRFFKAFQIIRKKIGPFDIVHLNKLYPFGIFALFLKWFYKKPFIISEHWTGYLEKNNERISKLNLQLSKTIVKQAGFICPVSYELKNAMLNLGFNGNYEIVPNVVDTKVFKPQGKNSNSFTLIHISNMVDEHKNISGILRSVSNLSIDFKLLLIGENSEKYTLLSKKLGILDKVIFLQHLEHEEIPKYLQSSNVYISFSNYETWGISMIEALSCGVPVISTNTGIIHELKLHNFSKIITMGDESALTEAILDVYYNGSFDKAEMHQYVANNFGVDIIAQQFANLYQKTLT